MARFAIAAERGGAAGIRANGVADITAIRRVTSLPIFGIEKRIQHDGRILITPSLEDARSLVAAGATVVAVECTARAQRFGALGLIPHIRSELSVPVMADIATPEEAVAAENAGADLVATTMRGYTDDTFSSAGFEPEFVKDLVARLTVPILAEGRVQTPEEAVSALRAGAFAVIVGSAITRPELVTSRFTSALANNNSAYTSARSVVGIDLGGTNTKAGVLNGRGVLQHEWTTRTPSQGRAALLTHLGVVARNALEQSAASGIRAEAVGIATAGWVNAKTGQIVYASENLPEWTGTRVARELEDALSLPVAVENDANALAIAERHFGVGRDVDDFVCITLGTGVGGSCYSGGRLLRGAHHLANAIGHVVTDPNGEPCSCGKKGCLETLANAAALVRYAHGKFSSAEHVISAAHAGDDDAKAALTEYADQLGVGIASIVRLLDPAIIVLAGGLSTNNDLLIARLNAILPSLLISESQQPLKIVPSALGYYGAVYGACVRAREALVGHTATY